MKKFNLKSIVLMLTFMCGANVMAQTEYSVHFGGILPNGDFAKSRASDRADVIWLGDGSKKGGAGIGVDLGVKLKSNFASIEGLGFIATADVFFNGNNSDVKEYKEDVIDEFDDFDDCNYVLPKWLNIPIMAGLNYEAELKKDLDLWTEFALGANIGKLTSDKLYAEESGYEISYIYKYELTFSLAYQLGVGVKLSDKFSLGLHYYSLGDRKIKGEYIIDDDGDEDSDDFNFKSINPTMLTFRIGYCF